MKLNVHVSLCLLATVLAPFVHGQRYAKTEWEITTGGANDSRYSAAVPLPSGDVIWVGSKENNTSRTDIWVRRITEDGTVVWTNTFVKPGATGNCYVRKALLGPSGNVIIGADVTGNATAYDTYFLKIDQDGNMIVDATIDLYDWDLLSDMEVGESGNIVFTSDSTDPEQYQATKLDTNFVVQWTYYMGNIGRSGQYANDVEIAPNGDVLVAGIVSDGVQRDVQLDRISPNGLFQYSKNYGDSNLDDAYPTVLTGLNSKTYFAYAARAFDPTSVTVLLQLDTFGNTLWAKLDSDITGPQIAQTPLGDIVIGGVTFPTPGVSSQKFAKFTEAGANLWVTDVNTPTCEHNFTHELQIAPDGLIYTDAHFTATGVVGCGWLVNCLSSDGVLVYQWKLSHDPDMYNFPGGMVALSGGALLIGGEVGTVSDDDASVRRLQAEFNVFPLSTTIRLGRLNSGNLASLIADDNNFYELCRFLVPNLTVPPINLELDSFVPASYPANSIEFEVVSKASTGGVTQNVELWNWTTSAWERSALQAMNGTEQSTTVTGSVVDNLQAGTRFVKARIRVSQTGIVAQSVWCVQFDQATWLARP